MMLGLDLVVWLARGCGRCCASASKRATRSVTRLVDEDEGMAVVA